MPEGSEKDKAVDLKSMLDEYYRPLELGCSHWPAKAEHPENEQTPKWDHELDP